MGNLNKKVELVGDYDWNTCRCLLIYRFMRLKTEKEFTELIYNLSKSVGTKKELEKTRKELGIKPFTENDERRLK